jgi:formylglycine-generating enzyme required for sulfatase activity
MPRLQTLLECIGRAIRQNGWPSPDGPAFSGGWLLEIIRSAQQRFALNLSHSDLHSALQEVVAAPQGTVDLTIQKALAALPYKSAHDDRAALTGFLELLPFSARQALRRPGDSAGTVVPEALPFKNSDDWLEFFPDRMARFKSGAKLEEFDNWRLMELRGFGPHCETWQGTMEDSTDNASAALKFITDPEVAGDFASHEDLFRKILDLEPLPGLVHLRSVYLLADPPCLESDYVPGYDAASLIHDWRWRNEKTKPDQVALLIRRVAKIVGHLHRLELPIVHRGLKPSNILLYPTAEGKVSIWVSDIGWGEISSARGQAHSDQVQARKLSRRGAHAPLYASPQQMEGQAPDPRDDVYALGMIWYQLLERNPAAHPPVGNEWALALREDGLSDGHARLLSSCLEANPDNRPVDGRDLAAQIEVNFGKPTGNGLEAIRMKGSSSTMKPLEQERGKSSQRRTAAHPPVFGEMPKTLTNSIGIEFVQIPAGSFPMGSPAEEKSRHKWEGPVHPVRITRPFYLGVVPVTQSQYLQLVSRNPSYFTPTRGGAPDFPVEQLSWDEAVTFCERLTALAAETAHCRIYRLPTEAEWEYACRAGTTTPYYLGESVTIEEVHYFGLSASTSAKVLSATGKPEKVGSHSANPWGLFDMHGNVLEWCQDWWSETYYAESPAVDPAGPRDGWQRVARGGSFSQFAADCRSAARLGRAPGARLNTVGFRVAMNIPGI